MISGVDGGCKGGGVGEEEGWGVGGKEGGVVVEVAFSSGERQCIGGASSTEKYTNDKPQVEGKGGEEADCSTLHAVARKVNEINFGLVQEVLMENTYLAML